MSWSVPWRNELTDASLPSKSESSASTTRGLPALSSAGDGCASLPELVRRSKGGNRDAFALVYEQCAPAVHALLRASLPHEQCEDLHQEVFVTAWSTLPRFDLQQPFAPWVYGIARNLLRQRLREFARSRTSSVALEELPAKGGIVAPLPTVGEPNATSNRAERALRHLHALPDAEREILGLRIIEGLGAQAIAELIQSTPGSVRVRVHRALQRLRRLCQEDSE
jgi:RNA polymerase sigma-70 factor, ECF subfamily